MTKPFSLYFTSFRQFEDMFVIIGKRNTKNKICVAKSDFSCFKTFCN